MAEIKKAVSPVSGNEKRDEAGEIKVAAEMKVKASDKPYDEMTVAELQEAILEKMKRNGPVTEYMLGTVRENTHHGSLLNWVRSFN